MKEKLQVLAALVFLLGVLLACGGVSVNSTQINTPENQPSQFLVTCGNDSAECVNEANRVCPDGVEILSQDGSTEGSSGFAYRGMFRSNSHNRHDWIVRCSAQVAAR